MQVSAILQGRQFYRIFTSILIHADFMHLALNLFVLYSFGKALELYLVYLGRTESITLPWLFLFFGAGIFANLVSLFRNQHNLGYSSLGASGGVSGIVFACIAAQPTSEVLLFAAIPMPAFVAGLLFLGVEFFLLRRGKTHINHGAHLAGAVWGFLFAFYFFPGAANQWLSIFSGKTA